MADYPLVLPVLTDEVGTALQPLNAPDMPSWAAHISREVEAIAAELGLSPSAAFSTVTARFADIDSQLGALPGTYLSVDPTGQRTAFFQDDPPDDTEGDDGDIWFPTLPVTELGFQPLSSILTLTTASFTTADETKLDGIEAGATADQTAAEILTAIKTVDGAASGLDADLLDGADLSTDGTMAGNSDALVPSQKAVKTYADQLIASADAMVFKGVIDASSNPNYPAADRGHTYRISVAGKIGGASGTNVEAGDLIVCLTDGTAAGTQAAVGASWSVVQANLDGAVIGPASATDGALAAYDGTTGKLIKTLGITPSNDDVLQRKAGAWTNRTPAQLKTDLVLAKGDVGLGNVDNTSDANKPVSTAQQSAIDAKVADAINDGVTTTAPSQNAVFDGFTTVLTSIATKAGTEEAYVPSLITSGEENMSREVARDSATMTSGVLRIAYWTARKTESITKVRIYSGATAAGATPTLIRVGIYSVAGNGDLTLIGSTANDTTLLAAQNTSYEKALQATFSKVKGTRYAIGVLVVTGATAPTIAANQPTVAAMCSVAPRICGALTAQTDLPAGPFSDASLTVSNGRPYAYLVP